MTTSITVPTTITTIFTSIANAMIIDHHHKASSVTITPVIGTTIIIIITFTNTAIIFPQLLRLPLPPYWSQLRCHLFGPVLISSTSSEVAYLILLTALWCTHYNGLFYRWQSWNPKFILQHQALGTNALKESSDGHWPICSSKTLDMTSTSWEQRKRINQLVYVSSRRSQWQKKKWSLRIYAMWIDL